MNFLLGISELDPIENDLIFERFLNPERVSMPDIDCDFSNREFIIDYLTQKYGEDRVCQIINYSYITPVSYTHLFIFKRSEERYKYYISPASRKPT